LCPSTWIDGINRRLRLFDVEPHNAVVLPGSPLVFPVPVDADEVALFVEMHAELAMKGSLHPLANPPWKVDIGRVDDDAVRHVLDAHDAIQRMVAFFDLLLMASNCEDLGFVLLNRWTSQGYSTSRVLIVDAVTGLA
jgi:predicted RNA methylase